MRWPWSKPVTAAAAAPAAPPQSSSAPAVGGVSIPPFLKVSRRYPVDRITPVRLREIRRQADLGETQEYCELLEDIAADEQVDTLLKAMKLPVAGAPFCVEPAEGDTSDLGKEIAAGGLEFLRRIPDFRQLLVDLMDAEYMSFSALQLGWVSESDGWWVRSHKSFESRLFRFPGDAETPWLCTEAAPGGAPLPEGVLFYRVRQRPGAILRGGIGWSIGRPWVYKGFSLVDMLSFTERFGHPHVQVQVPASATEGSRELEMAKNAAKSLIVDQVGLVPPGVTVSILDNIGKSATVKDVYGWIIEWCDAALAKAFLGQSSTTDDQRSEGSQAKAKTGLQVKNELSAQRAGRLAEFVTKQLLAPWALYHYGPKAPAPVFELEVEPPTDEAQEATRRKTDAETVDIVARRLPLSAKELYGKFKLSPPENDADRVGGPAAAPAGNAGATASSRGEGTCPGCGEVINLAEAQKKKRLQDWAS